MSELMTRAQLLEQVLKRGYIVPTTTLVYWEKRGILPRAIRTRRDGKPVALYPPSRIDEVCHVRTTRRHPAGPSAWVVGYETAPDPCLRKPCPPTFIPMTGEAP